MARWVAYSILPDVISHILDWQTSLDSPVFRRYYLVVALGMSEARHVLFFMCLVETGPELPCQFVVIQQGFSSLSVRHKSSLKTFAN